MNPFGSLSPRMQEFRSALLDKEPSICVERAQLTTEAYKQHSHRPMVLRRALMLENILKHMSIYIEPQTRLAGNQAKANRSAPIFPEYAMDWVLNELDQFAERNGDRFHIDESSKDILRGIAPFWEGNTLKERGLAAMPPSSRVFYDLGIIKAEGNITSGDAHLAVNYENVLRYGLQWYRQRTQEKLAALDLAEYAQLQRSFFYEAVLVVLDAVIAFAHRYAQLAAQMAADTDSALRRQELLEMARILQKVPEEPAATLAEAVQSIWLLHVVLQIESNGHSLSYGRLDQYLWPFYRDDLAAGRTTETDACELLTNLWLKTYSVNKIRSASHTRFSAGSPLYQNVTIGGQTPAKEDGVNPMSYIILRSVAQVRLPQPNLTVRYHAGLAEPFFQQCLQLVALGTGMPAFNNDEIIIPSFLAKGVTEADAYNYSAIGCVEVAVPGKWGYRCTGMSFLNFARSLMIALNDGVDPDSGTRLAPGTGHFRDMTDFDQVMHAWDITIREFTRQSVIIDSCADLVLEQTAADVLCSALTDDCIERGLTLKEGGAVYDFISGLQVGIANLADSLAAVKKCVFEERLFSPAELWEALRTDFAGEQGQRIQAQLQRRAPKYGNDDDYVDQLLVTAYESFLDELSKHKNTRYGRGPIGGVYYGGTSSITANVPQGASTPATPDGRPSGTPLAEGCSPGHGRDTQGPTAVFKSIAKLPTEKLTGGVLLNQKVTPEMLANPANMTKLGTLVRAFFNGLRGFHVQYNVVSRETLLDAQQHPERHRDLIVRVAGYSAFFNVLSKQTQDDIIARTEQQL